MSSLSQLRSALASIENYTLPDKFADNTNSSSSSSVDDDNTSKKPFSTKSITSHNESTNDSNTHTTTTTPTPEQIPLVTNEMIQRYRKARDTYLQHRITDMFLDHFSTMEDIPPSPNNNNNNNNNNSNSSSNNNNNHHAPFRPHVQFPPASTPEEEAELLRLSHKVKQDLCTTSQRVQTNYHNLHAKYKTFCDKRTELSRMICDLEEMEEHKVGSGTSGKGRNGENAMDVEEDDPEISNDEMSDNDGDNEETDQDTAEEAELLQQEEKLKALRIKKSQMECKLRSIQMQSQEVSVNIQRSKVQVQELLVQRGANEEAASISTEQDKEDGGGENKEEVEEEEQWSVQEMEQETEELRKRTEYYKQMSEYYEEIRGTMEELGGIKILNVSHASESNNDSTSSSPSSTSPDSKQQTAQPMDTTHSPTKKRSSPSRRKRSSPPTQLSNRNNGSPKNNNGGESIHVKVLLLDKHIILLTLTSDGMRRLIQRRFGPSSSSPSSPSRQYAPSLRVTDAQFQTSVVLTDQDHQQVMDTNNMTANDETTKTPSVSITIPPLDDLVARASNLEPKQDFQFIIGETISRIRTLTARVEQLSQLRTKYLTKITKFSSSSPSKNHHHHHNNTTNTTPYGYAYTEDQEVVCSLNVGITVVLSLTADCPMIEGSVFISQMVGVGGWDDTCLARIKSRVNERKVKGPVEIMDALVDEIGRVEREDGMKMPETPVFPNKKVRRGTSTSTVGLNHAEL